MSEHPASDGLPIFKIWADALADTLGQISGNPVLWEVRADSSAQLPPPSEQDLWFVGVLGGSLRGELAFRLPPTTVIWLAHVFADLPESETAALTDQHREALAELLRQVGGIVATSLHRPDGEVQLRIESAMSPPSWPASATMGLRGGTDAAPYWIEMQISAALATSLRATAAEEPAQKPPERNLATPQSNVNLSVLMDVELDVSLRFGSRRLSLREILDLTHGAVIELNQQVREPVDLLLDRRVVARGEVVVVQGNFGLRVTELVSGN